MSVQFNIRLSPETVAVINAIAAELICSQADVIRQAVRLLAQREGVWEQRKSRRKKSSEKSGNAVDNV